MLINLISYISKGIKYIQRHGIRVFLKETSYRLCNIYFEIKYGVNTSGMITMTDLGYDDPDYIDYGPIGYKNILKILKMIPLDPESSVFLDYGSGMGRAIVAAATFPFKRIIGIEISETLNNICLNNIERMKHKRANNVACLNLDATKYKMDNDINLIYFFNPFKGAVLEKVVENIYESYSNNPRLIYIIYFNSIHFENIVRDCQWIKKIYETSFYPNYSCRVYRVDNK